MIIEAHGRGRAGRAWRAIAASTSACAAGGLVGADDVVRATEHDVRAPAPRPAHLDGETLTDEHSIRATAPSWHQSLRMTRYRDLEHRSRASGTLARHVRALVVSLSPYTRDVAGDRGGRLGAQIRVPPVALRPVRSMCLDVPSGRWHSRNSIGATERVASDSSWRDSVPLTAGTVDRPRTICDDDRRRARRCVAMDVVLLAAPRSSGRRRGRGARLVVRRRRRSGGVVCCRPKVSAMRLLLRGTDVVGLPVVTLGGDDIGEVRDVLLRRSGRSHPRLHVEQAGRFAGRMRRCSTGNRPRARASGSDGPS